MSFDKAKFELCISKIKENQPFIIYLDNDHLLPVNFEDAYYVKDDDFLYYIRTNDTLSVSFNIPQHDKQFTTTIVPYDLIWYIKVFNNYEEIEKFISDKQTLLPNDSLDKIKSKLITKASKYKSPTGIYSNNTSVGYAKIEK